MHPQLWIEPVGDLILVRVRGTPTESLLKECQDRLLQLIQDLGPGTVQARVLYDVLEMEAPPVQVPLSQWKLDSALGSVQLRRAVLVPNTRLAYLARLAFGDGDLRVFYNDLTAAIQWLTGDPELRAARTSA